MRTGIIWSNLGKPVMFGPVDGRAVFFILIALYHWALWTFALAVAGILFLFWLQRLGYSIPNLLRRIGVLIMGNKRMHKTSRKMRSDI